MIEKPKVSTPNNRNLVIPAIILALGLIFAASSLANSIREAGFSIKSDPILEEVRYELVFDEGYMYMYDTINGDVFKKPKDEDGEWTSVTSLPYTQ